MVIIYSNRKYSADKAKHYTVTIKKIVITIIMAMTIIIITIMVTIIIIIIATIIIIVIINKSKQLILYLQLIIYFLYHVVCYMSCYNEMTSMMLKKWQPSYTH